ncbi:MAG: hypothetical protein AB8B49_07655 [Nitratireductor sp.]
MRYYLKIFFWAWFPITVLGLFTGTLNLMNPKAVFIPDGKTVGGHEGFDGVIAATVSAGVYGIIFGVVAIGIGYAFKKGTKKVYNSDRSDIEKEETQKSEQT